MELKWFLNHLANWKWLAQVSSFQSGYPLIKGGLPEGFIPGALQFIFCINALSISAELPFRYRNKSLIIFRYFKS